MIAPTVAQIHAYLLAHGWELDAFGAAAYLMVTRGHTLRMLHEPTEYDRDKAVFDIALAERRHPADVRDEILAGPVAVSQDTAVPLLVSASDVAAMVAYLRDRRLALGLSQREVARRAGFAPSLLSDYENSVHEPTLSKLVAWADALGCDVTLTVRPAPPLRTRFDSLDELRQDMRDNAWARRVAAPATPDDINEIKQRLGEYESAKEEPT